MSAFIVLLVGSMVAYCIPVAMGRLITGALL